jgi:tRNA(Glu) U13 pseudouridine synthase TruD
VHANTIDGVSFTQPGHTLKGAYRPLLSMPTNLTLRSSSGSSGRVSSGGSSSNTSNNSSISNSNSSSGSSSSSSNTNNSKSDSSCSNSSSSSSFSSGDAVVCVSFDLQPGCFATMAMRELTKQDTDLVASSAERALAADVA